MSSTAVYDPNMRLMNEAAPRRLGSVLARPRDLYMLYMPLIMVMAGLACWVVETDLMMVLGALVLTAVALYMFYGMVVNRAPLRVSTVLVTSLGLGYGLGTVNTWFSVPRAGQELGSFLHRDTAALAHVMGSVLFSMAIVLAVGELVEKPIFGEDFELHFSPQAILFISIGVGVLLFAYANGSLGYMGATIGAANELGVFAAFGSWLSSTLFGMTLLAALNARGKWLRRYLSLLVIIEFFLEIPLGRRNLIYAVVLAGIALRLGRWRLTWSWPKRIISAALLGAVLYSASLGFFYLRLAGFAAGKAHLSIFSRVSLAIDYFENKNFDEVHKEFSQNVQTRTFILGWLAELETYSNLLTPGYGRDLEGQLLITIPSVIYPTKNRFFGEEGLVDELFGTVYTDEANSVLTAGVVDFGLLGMVLYPLMVCFVLRAFFEFIGKHLPTFVAVFVIMSGIANLLQAENSVTDYIILMRNGLLFGMAIWFCIALPEFRLRKEK